ncbi:MAG: Hsp20/alpha crystallin family protein [Candidatus Moraniibacteriota bacterium]|nr:MAG: Hsp20/alpha crystallin family protein [Candidatus Moranbacteria bacterium]
MTRGIIHWSPMRELDRFFDEDVWARGFAPAVDIRQDKDNVIVDFQLPDIDPTKVSIMIENDVLTVSGASEEKSEVKREDYYRKEIHRGEFSRSIILPMKVEGDRADASYEKGLLTITVPKAEEVKPKRIAVNVK